MVFFSLNWYLGCWLCLSLVSSIFVASVAILLRLFLFPVSASYLLPLPLPDLLWLVESWVGVMLYSSIHLLVSITFASVHPSYAAYLRLSLIGYNCCVESWSIDLSKSVYTGLSLAFRHLYFSSSHDPGELIIISNIVWASPCNKIAVCFRFWI